MKTPKLLKIVSRYLSADKKKQYEHTRCFKDVLKKLKKREINIKEELKKEKDDKKRKQLEKDLAIVCEQRRKGIYAIKKLEKDS